MHYYQFNIADYRKQTAHLTPIEHYIYRSLLDWYYLEESQIPKETQVVMRRLSLANPAEEVALKNVLSDFFTETDDGYSQSRANEVIDEYHQMREKNRKNGSKGGRPKGNKTQSVTSGLPEESQINPNHKPITNNQEPIQDKTLLSGEPDPSPRSKQKEEAKGVLDFLNEKTGKRFKPVAANMDMILARFKEGYTPRELCQIIAKKSREWAGNEDMAQYLRPATLFGRKNCAQYSGELGVSPAGGTSQ